MPAFSDENFTRVKHLTISDKAGKLLDERKYDREQI